MRLPARAWKSNTALLLCSVMFSLVLAEGAYRLHLLVARKRYGSILSYGVTSGVFVRYDEKLGAFPKPDSEFWLSRVSAGRLVWGKLLWSSNRDGLCGKATIADYHRASTKILAFGDSFTQFMQERVTWPDLLEQNLREFTHGDVAVLNYGREGCGVMQMLDFAADKVDELHPDYVIIAVIGDDFTRARTWHREVEKEGRTRWMVSTKQNDFLDYHFASDHELVYPAATREWCERTLHSGAAFDPVLDHINDQYRDLKREVDAVIRPFHPLAVDRSYLYARLSTGTAFGRRMQDIPRIGFDDYYSDQRTRTNFMRLNRSGSRVFLAYLPLADELKTGVCNLDRQSSRLMTSLEKIAESNFWLLQRHYDGPIPSKIDNLPMDGHPNLTGLQLYADILTHLINANSRSARSNALVTSP
jgi:hypothetical protein